MCVIPQFANTGWSGKAFPRRQLNKELSEVVREQTPAEGPAGSEALRSAEKTWQVKEQQGQDGWSRRLGEAGKSWVLCEP